MIWMNNSAIGFIVTTLVVATACTLPRANANAGDGLRSQREVPGLPPTTGMPNDVAAEVYAAGNIVREDSVMTGPYPRDMIWVWFRDNASQVQRQAAIDAISGIVVGGYRFRPGGVYYVRIKHDGTTVPLHSAIAKLKTFPQVSAATPDLSLAVTSNQAR
jgi:hypothetical protein